ncbi:MAG: GNAT family N-acetyltransferase [Pedobacter sp.]|nr:MAG: GNAT family N-acetyltransferase [Pedobacter sp.]
MAIIIRNIVKEDNSGIAELIRKVFREFKIDKPGTVYFDPTTDRLYEYFRQTGSVYWIAEEDGELLGACGIYPTEGLPQGYAELVKFYLSEEVRGKGIGHQLMEQSLNSAKELGYTDIYLESFPELEKAISMYLRSGFEFIDKPLGNSGHYACNVWMAKKLLVDS